MNKVMKEAFLTHKRTKKGRIRPFLQVEIDQTERACVTRSTR